MNSNRACVSSVDCLSDGNKKGLWNADNNNNGNICIGTCPNNKGFFKKKKMNK